MKVVYYGHFTEGSGWSYAAIDYVYALEAAGVDVVCRNIPLTNNNYEPPSLIVELLQKDDSDCTHCIQHVLPHHLFASDRYKKNIAYFVAETDISDWHSWNENLRLVDEIWVPNDEIEDNLDDRGYIVKKVQHTCDIAKYSTLYPDITIPQITSTYKFYTIVDLNERKNLESVIKCFHHTFDPSEPVSLILKVKKYGITPDKLTGYVKELCNQIKTDMRMYANLAHYHPEVIVTGHSSDQDICALHQYGDCFVNLSHGEAWSVPTFDACGFGNKVISSAVAGPLEYLTGYERAELIEGVDVICRCRDSAFPELFTGRDFWTQPNEREVCYAMRNAFESRDEVATRNNYEFLQRYSYQTIGQKMKELL